MPPPPLASPRDDQAYAIRLVAWLRRFETYPEAARRQGRDGLVHVRLRIDSDGRIRGQEILRAEGGRDFVAATERMLRDAAPLPPPPGLPPGGETVLELRLPYRVSPAP
jgi:protein TonB